MSAHYVDPGGIFDPGAPAGTRPPPAPPAPTPPTGVQKPPVRWSYVCALLTCAFVAPVVAFGMEYTWAVQRFNDLMAHGGAPSGTEYVGMIAVVMMVMGS